jgi:hypothetical protein
MSNPHIAKLKLLVTVAALSYLVIGAGSQSCNKAPKPTPDIPTDTEQCGAAEVRLHELDCFNALGFPGGKVKDPTTGEDLSFTQFCENAQRAGTHVFPSCLAKIEVCAEIETECWR